MDFEKTAKIEKVAWKVIGKQTSYAKLLIEEFGYQVKLVGSLEEIPQEPILFNKVFLVADDLGIVLTAKIG
jgi:hypothetical protein